MHFNSLNVYEFQNSYEPLPNKECNTIWSAERLSGYTACRVLSGGIRYWYDPTSVCQCVEGSILN